MVRGESGSYGDALPVVRLAALRREAVDFILGQVSCFHVVSVFLLKTEGFHQADDIMPQVIDDRGKGIFVGVLFEI